MRVMDEHEPVVNAIARVHHLSQQGMEGSANSNLSKNNES